MTWPAFGGLAPPHRMEHLDHAFATTWPLFDLDPKTHALLTYTKKLTETPAAVDDADFDALRAVGWDEDGISLSLACQ